MTGHPGRGADPSSDDRAQTQFATAESLARMGADPVLLNSRLLLVAGFGGLLLLMGFAGLGTFHLLQEIQTASDAARGEYLARNRALEQIRSELYLSGTYVRDYLLEPEALKAADHLVALANTRTEMDSALARYRGLLTGGQGRPFDDLVRQIQDYWKVLDPVFRWTTEERRTHSYRFLHDEIFPRRQAMLRIADQIAILNEGQLSDGNRRVGAVFSQFRGQLSVTLLLTVLLGLALAGFSVYRILRLEYLARARFWEIAQARTELKELSARLVETQENDRRAISRELHDEVGQSLSAVLVELGILSKAIRGVDDPRPREQVDSIRKLVEECVGVVRNMALLLRPSMLDDLGLVPALQWQAREVSRRTGMRVKVAVEGVSDELPESHRTCVYRIVQEALHNCSRHAEARVVRIAVRQEPDRLVLSIQDDGKGFDTQRTRGLGLLGMQERVAYLGGAFEMQSEPGGGTLLSIVIPFSRQGAAVGGQEAS